MIISRISVERPVFAAVLSLVLLILGGVALSRMSIRQYPDVDPPQVSVRTTYRGAPARVVDADVTKRIIDELGGVDDIEYIDARSSNGISQIDIEFEIDRNLDFAAADVRGRINRVRARLPEAIDDPVVEKASANAEPIMWLTLTSEKFSRLELTDMADRVLEETIATLPGVADVIIGGERRYAMRIWLDRAAMAARDVTVGDITRALQNENIEIPSGRLESRGREFTVRSLSRLESPEEFANLVIRDTNAEQVRLGDVADVKLGAENYRRVLRSGAEKAVGLGVIRLSDANTVAVSDRIRTKLTDFQEQLPAAADLEISYDQAEFIRASIYEVIQTLLIALGLVVLVILMFLGSLRATIVPALTIPVSIVGTATVAVALGFSINVLTLLAAVLAIGLVVDDAVVVLENIERRTRLGEGSLLAAVRGTAEVGFAVIATTVVLVAVFMPIAFLTGKVGRLFTQFGIVLAVAVVFSSLVALTLGAMLSSRLLESRDPEATADDEHSSGSRSWFRRLGERIQGGFAGLRKGYEKALGWTFRLRWLVVVLMVLLTAAAVALYWVAPRELAPKEDQGNIFVIVESPEGASIEYTVEQLKEVEEFYGKRYGEEGGPLDTIISISPGVQNRRAVNTASAIVKLKDWGEREVSAQQIVRETLPELLQNPGALTLPVNPPSLGLQGTQQPVKFVVGGPTFDNANDWSEAILARAEETGLFREIRSSYNPTQPQLLVTYDTEQMANLGITKAQLGESLQGFLGGLEATDYYDRGELYEVVLQAKAKAREDLRDLLGIYVRSRDGELVPISQLVSVDYQGAERELRRFDRSPAVVLSGSLVPGVSLGEALSRLEQIAREETPAGLEIGYLGESLEYKTSQTQLLFVFTLALVLVYLALAAQFESFIDPITIMLSVPLAVVGGLAAIVATGQSLNIYSQIGLIMLIGLTAKNGILLVEFANQLRQQGAGVADAAREAAGIRLRPILMTVISTVFGSLPLVLATGAGAEGRQAIGIIIVSGMLFASLLTLFVIPAIYTLLAPLTATATRTKEHLAEQRQESHEEQPQAS